MIVKRWRLIKREKEFDIFTNGFSIYAGVLEKGKPLYAYEIDSIDTGLDSKTRNYIRKQVAKVRKIKKRKVMYYSYPTIKVFDVVGYAWDSGNLFLIGEDGLMHYESDCYIFNKRSKSLIDKLKKLIKERDKIDREIDRIEKKLEKYRIDFEKHFLGE